MATYVTTTAGDLANGVAAAAAGATAIAVHQNGATGTTNMNFPLAIKAIASKTGFVRVYDETLGGTVTTGTLSANLPQISNLGQIVAHGQYDDAAPWYSQGGGVNPATGAYYPADWGSNSTANPTPFVPRWGMIEFRPTIPAADTVNAASVPTFKVDANTLVVLATG